MKETARAFNFIFCSTGSNIQYNTDNILLIIITLLFSYYFSLYSVHIGCECVPRPLMFVINILNNTNNVRDLSIDILQIPVIL